MIIEWLGGKNLSKCNQIAMLQLFPLINQNLEKMVNKQVIIWINKIHFRTIEKKKKDKTSSKINNIPYQTLQQAGHKASVYLSPNYFLKATSAWQ